MIFGEVAQGIGDARAGVRKQFQRGGAGEGVVRVGEQPEKLHEPAEAARARPSMMDGRISRPIARDLARRARRRRGRLRSDRRDRPRRPRRRARRSVRDISRRGGETAPAGLPRVQHGRARPNALRRQIGLALYARREGFQNRGRGKRLDQSKQGFGSGPSRRCKRGPTATMIRGAAKRLTIRSTTASRSRSDHSA